MSEPGRPRAPRRTLCESCGLRRPVDEDRCASCGTLTPEWYVRHRPPAARRRRHLLLWGGGGALALGLVVSTVAELPGAAVSLVGGLALVVHALPVVHGSST